MSVTIRNPRGDTPPDPPTRTSGEPYRFEMIHDGGKWRTYADTAVELLTALIPGYGDLPTPAGQATARVLFATQVQVALQAELNAAGPLERCTDQQRETLLAPRHVPPAPETWDAPIPLVLIRTFYQPAGPTPEPRAGRPDALIWLDPASEWEMLRSLHIAGEIDLATSDPPPGPATAGPEPPPSRGDD